LLAQDFEAISAASMNNGLEIDFTGAAPRFEGKEMARE
jgi:hypothetical protein